MCYFCTLAYAGGGSNASSGKKYTYTIDDFGALTIKPLHLDLILDFGATDFKTITVGTYVYNGCLDKADEIDQKADLTTIVLDQDKLDVESVEIILNNADNTAFKPASLNLVENDWVAHRAQFEGIPTTEDEEKSWSNEGKLTFSTAQFSVDNIKQQIRIELPTGQGIKVGQQFIVRTRTTSSPDEKDLTGVYYDLTPPNCPQTMISQCQQYGARKIFPTIDQMPSKCSYTTTIIADGRYTNILSNGDFAPQFDQINPTTQLLEPRYHNPSSHFPRDGGNGDNRGDYQKRKVLRYHNFQLMATYLFFIGIGTYLQYSRDVEYPLHVNDPVNIARKEQGEEPISHRSFRIDLITPPNLFKHAHCVEKLKMIHDAIIWVYISGPSNATCEYQDLRKQIYALLKRREELKDLLGVGQYGVRAAIQQLAVEETTIVNAVINEYQQELIDGKPEAPHHMKNAVSVYDPIHFPLTTQPGDATLSAELLSVRTQLASLLSSVPFDTWSHQYTQNIYREIGMSRSNFGGMENVGNTTIVVSSLASSPFMTDGVFVYMAGVTVHEYYHDLNGSSVTGQSPFTIYLNEAVTVHQQRYQENEIFGFEAMRLQQVKYAFAPGSGPLAIDSAPNAMAIVPEGFNTTHELISAMTYSKAPEALTKTFERLMGSNNFQKALTLYYKRFAKSNATTHDWVQAMVDITGDETLHQCAEKHLKVSGYPTLQYSGVYDAANKRYTLHFKQTGWEHHELVKGPWRFAVEIELFDASGNKLLPAKYKNGCSCQMINSVEGEACVYDFKVAEEDVIFEGIEMEPLFASVGRGWSFFGKTQNVSLNKNAELLAQVKYDDDCVNKMLAWNAYKNDEVARLTREFATFSHADKANTDKKIVTPNAAWIDLHASILFNNELGTAARGAILEESSEVCVEPDVCFEYWASSNAITALLQGIWAKYSKEIVQLYNELNALENRKWPLTNGFKQRPLKRHLLHIMREVVLKERVITTEYNTNDINLFALAKELVFGSEIMSDRVMGLKFGMEIIAAAYAIDETKPEEIVLTLSPKQGDDDGTNLNSALYVTTPLVTLEESLNFFKETQTFFTSHPNAIEQYVLVMGSLHAPNNVSFIQHLIKQKFFQVSAPGHARSLARAWSSLRMYSLLTNKGLALTHQLLLFIGKVNGMSAYSFLQLHCDLGKFDLKRKTILSNALQHSCDQFDPQTDASLVNNINSIIAATKTDKE